MSHSDNYTHGHHEAVRQSHRMRTAENSAAYLLGHLNADHRLLDVGCGVGTITADLAEVVAPGEVVALDREPAIVDEAATCARDRGLTNVTPVVGDVYGLDFEASSFDVVHAHQVLQHLSDPVAALGEMGRVAKAGGVVAVRDADYGAMRWFPDDPDLDHWIEIYSRVARANDAEPDAGRRLLSWGHAAGFTSIETTASVWCFADAPMRQWWGGTWAERMTSSAVATQALADGFAREDELAAIADAFRRWADHDDGVFTVVHTELLLRK